MKLRFSILALFLAASSGLGALAQKKGRPKPPAYCTTDGKNGSTYCGYCIREHKEWCDDETTPIPHCCAVVRENNKIHSCRCCFDKPASLEERGSHEHEGYNEEFLK